MHLYLDCSVRHIQSSHQIHLAELIALLKCCVKAVETLQDLSQLDIKIPPENVILLSDSRYCLLTSRSIPAFFNKKSGSVITKIQQTLAQFGLSTWENLCFLAQHELPQSSSPSPVQVPESESSKSAIPCPPNQRFHPDILSKPRFKASESQLWADFCSLHNMDWLEQHPSSWTFIKRNYAIPALDPNLLSQLGVHPERQAFFMQSVANSPKHKVTSFSTSGFPINTGETQQDSDDFTTTLDSKVDNARRPVIGHFGPPLPLQTHKA